jgi:hypothetical protein
VSADESDGLMETVHRLKSPASAVRLMRSVHDVHQEKFEPREHLEPVPSSSAALRSSAEGLRSHLASRRDRG